MIDLSDKPDFDFASQYEMLEDSLVSELEQMIYARLMSERTIQLNHEPNNEIEFLQRTTYKVMIRRPNKHVWSVPIPELRNAIRQVIRKGRLFTQEGKLAIQVPAKPAYLPEAIKALLCIIPEEEYLSRSMVGNKVYHQVYGEGVIRSITNTGNVEIAFKEKVTLLKPQFFRLVS